MNEKIFLSVLMILAVLGFTENATVVETKKAVPVFQSELNNHQIDSIFREVRIPQLMFVGIFTGET